ncbi:TRPM8 channel-associated factor 3 [Folsomia candida]|uniref:TRPM8 channel-associated factor 3 n=1 Tax=Folsomia candida TaxID=158441 RepID=A0A226DTU0_FOLCA|nr:TRPM8 channel-associated factor 3 [Folsomia candida]
MSDEEEDKVTRTELSTTTESGYSTTETNPADGVQEGRGFEIVDLAEMAKRKALWKSNNKLKDVDQILDGLTSIKGGSKVGSLFVFGSDAFPILAGKVGSGFSPVAAASRYSKGRIVFLSHESFFLPGDEYLDKFHVNCIMWAANYDERSPKLLPVVVKSTVRGSKDISRYLTESGYPSRVLSEDDIDLNLFNLVIIPTALDISDGFVTKLDAYTRNGGGLIIAANSGARTSTHIRNMAANKIAKNAGVFYVHEPAQPSLEDGTYNTSTNLLTYTSLNDAVRGVTEVLDKIEKSVDYEVQEVDNVKFTSAMATLKAGVQILDRADLTWVNAIKKKWFNLRPLDPRGNFTEVNITDGLRRRVHIDTEILNGLFNAYDNYAHPASDHFPGAVKTETDFKTTHVVTIDLEGDTIFETLALHDCTQTEEYLKKSNRTEASFPGFWESGFYAPAGVRVTIKSFSNEIQEFSIDNGKFEPVSRREFWNKYPTIHFTKKFSGNFGEFSDPFGGPIQIGKIVTPMNTKQVSIEITGAIETPHFFLGKARLSNWDRIKELDGPWGYFTAPSLQLKMPRRGFTLIDNPEELMISWQKVIDAFNEFHSVPYRSHKLKINFDIILRSKGAAMISSRHSFIIPSLPQRFHGGKESTNNINIQYVRTTFDGFSKDQSRPPEKLVPFVGNHSILGSKGSDVRTWFYYDLFRTFGWNVYFKMAILQKGVNFEGDRLTSITRNDWFLIQLSKLLKRNMVTYLDSWYLFTTKEAQKQVEMYKMSNYRAEQLFDMAVKQVYAKDVIKNVTSVATINLKMAETKTKSCLKNVSTEINSATKRATSNIKTAIKTVSSDVKGMVKNVTARTKTIIKDAGAEAKLVIRDAFRTPKEEILTAVDSAKDVLRKSIATIDAAVKKKIAAKKDADKVAKNKKKAMSKTITIQEVDAAGKAAEEAALEAKRTAVNDLSITLRNVTATSDSGMKTSLDETNQFLAISLKSTMDAMDKLSQITTAATKQASESIQFGVRAGMSSGNLTSIETTTLAMSTVKNFIHLSEIDLKDFLENARNDFNMAMELVPNAVRIAVNVSRPIHTGLTISADAVEARARGIDTIQEISVKLNKTIAEMQVQYDNFTKDVNTKVQTEWSKVTQELLTMPQKAWNETGAISQKVIKEAKDYADKVANDLGVIGQKGLKDVEGFAQKVRDAVEKAKLNAVV